MNHKLKKIIILPLVATLFTHADFVDIEKELYEPLEEMRQMDEAMNKAIQQRQEENRQIVEEQQNIESNMPMADFVLTNNQYVLEKIIDEPQNTKVDVHLDNDMVTINTETTRTQNIVTQEGTKSIDLKSTSKESLSLPYDADKNSFAYENRDGLLRITVDKKQTKLN